MFLVSCVLVSERLNLVAGGQDVIECPMEVFGTSHQGYGGTSGDLVAGSDVENPLAGASHFIKELNTSLPGIDRLISKLEKPFHNAPECNDDASQCECLGEEHCIRMTVALAERPVERG